jgi:hypothetical protein
MKLEKIYQSKKNRKKKKEDEIIKNNLKNDLK